MANKLFKFFSFGFFGLGLLLFSLVALGLSVLSIGGLLWIEAQTLIDIIFWVGLGAGFFGLLITSAQFTSGGVVPALWAQQIIFSLLFVDLLFLYFRDFQYSGDPWVSFLDSPVKAIYGALILSFASFFQKALSGRVIARALFILGICIAMALLAAHQMEGLQDLAREVLFPFGIGAVALGIVGLNLFSLHRRGPSVYYAAIGWAFLAVVMSGLFDLLWAKALFPYGLLLGATFNSLAYFIVASHIVYSVAATQRKAVRVEDYQLTQRRLIERTRDLQLTNKRLAAQIQKRLEFEIELKKSEKLKTAIFQSALDGILTFTPQGDIIDFNCAAEKVFGVSQLEVTMLPGGVFRLLPERYGSRLRERLQRQFTLGRGLPLNRRIQVKGLRGDGQEFAMEVALSLIEVEQFQTITAYVRDITDALRHKEEILRARQEAVSASLAKSEFLAKMSHEIRTPLNAIIGMSDLLSETKLDQEQQQFLNVCRRSSHTLLNLVNDILDLSKIESGKFDLDHREFDLYALLEGVSEMFLLKAKEKELVLSCEIDPTVPQMVWGDEHRLRQVFVNLLGNALKFTDRGMVRLMVSAEAFSDVTCRVRFVVSDTGIGIPEKVLERIFEKFVQSDSSVTRRFGGTGLGLAITKGLIEKMGGEIRVASQEGKGSQFSVELDLELAESQLHVSDSAQGKAWDWGQMKVLLLGEDSSMRMVVRGMLAAQGAKVTEVSSPQDALDLIRVWSKSPRSIDLVVTDLSLEPYGFFHWYEKLKEAVAGQGIPSLLVVADDLNQVDRQTVAAIDAVGPLLSPLSKERLLLAVSEAMDKRHRVKAGLGGHPAPLSQRGHDQVNPQDLRGRVLLVEDSADNRSLMMAYFASTQLEVEIAENGQMAVEKCFTEGHFDLVLMDVQMPVMDGRAATRAIRAEEQARGLARTPILALSAHALKEEVRLSLESGCDGYLTKPIQRRELFAELSKWLAKERFTKPSGDEGESSQLPLDGRLPEMVLAADCRAFPEPDLVELAEEFVVNRRQDLVLMKRALEEDNLEVIGRLAHTWKGICKPYGFLTLDQMSRAIESFVEARDLQSLRQQLDEADKFLTHVKWPSPSATLSGVPS